MYKIYKIFHNLNNQERLMFVGAAIIFCAAALFLGWRLYLAQTKIVPAAGGTYIEGLVGQPALINPVNAVAETDQDLIALLFSNLLQLTDSYKVASDSKTWTIALKKDLLWSDGQKLTADDVLFTINAIQDPNTHSPLYSDITNVFAERLNENELRLTLKNPYVFFIDTLKQLRPIPKHVFADIPITNFRLSNYNLEPVGSGPYLFVRFEKEKTGFITHYYLKANPNFHGEQPFIKDFRVRFFNTMPDLIHAFNRREITATGSLDAKNLELLQLAHQNFKINIPRYYAVFFNLSDQVSPAKEKIIRQALALAIDKKKIITAVFANGASRIDGPIFPGLEGYDERLSAINSFDPAEARRLLDETKIKTKITINLIVPQVSFLTDTAAIIKNNWSDVGVKTNLVVAEPLDVLNQFIKTRNYSALLYGNILRSNPDIASFWHSNERFYPGLNLSLYSNRNVDALLDGISRETNIVARQRKLADLQRLILEDQPAIFLFSPDYFYATTPQLHGFKTEFLASGSERFSDVHRWYLKTKRQFK